MSILKLDFDNENHKEMFVDWLMQHGEDDFYNFCEFSDDETIFSTSLVFNGKKVEEIKFNEKEQEK